jgi:hypothetical protein
MVALSGTLVGHAQSSVRFVVTFAWSHQESGMA